MSTERADAEETGAHRGGLGDDDLFSPAQLAWIQQMIVAHGRTDPPTAATTADNRIPPATDTGEANRNGRNGHSMRPPVTGVRVVQGRPDCLAPACHEAIPLGMASWDAASTALALAQTACAAPPYDMYGGAPPRAHTYAFPSSLCCSETICLCPFGAWLVSLHCLLAGSVPALPLFSLMGRGGPPLLSTSSLPSRPISASAVAKDAGTTDNSALALPSCSSVPSKLVKHLLEKQYMEMWKMLPET